MILEEETYKEFGYYSWELSPKSNKRIIVACDRCGAIRDTNKYTYVALCKTAFCRSCTHKGENNWNFGNRLSEETRRKISDSCKGRKRSKESRRKMGEARKGEKNCNFGKHLSQETKRKLHEINEGKHLSKETRRKISEGGKGKHAGKECYMWKGGLSKSKYCSKWNEIFREYIRNKFDRKCFLCGKSEAENGRKLSVHHVNYDKNGGCAETEEDKKADDSVCQFVPLCISCHSKIHNNRKNCETIIISKMRNKLNGWYI